MNTKYQNIFLAGFRATGKTTYGKTLARHLGWDFIDVDEELEKRAGMSINELTKGGTQWQPFRQMESDLVKECSQLKNTVVGLGGGGEVNNIIKNRTHKTFGELGTEFLHQIPKTLVILLTASEEVLAQRIRESEMKKPESSRPILDENKAKEIQNLLDQHKNNPEKQKEIMVDEIIKDSMNMYKIRKPLYAKITDNVIDTSEDDVEDVINQIIQYLHE